jgi:hypothetical protein
MVQGVAAKNADLLIDEKELSFEGPLQKNEFGTNSFGVTFRTVEGDQLVAHPGAFNLKRSRDGLGKQCHVCTGIYKHRDIGLSIARMGVAERRMNDRRRRGK